MRRKTSIGTAMRRLLSYSFVRFMLVGILNAIFGYLMFAFFIFIRFHYAIAALLSTIIGVIFNFFTTGRLVFNNKDNYRLIWFVMVYVVVYFINVGCLWVFNQYHVSNYLAGLVLIVPMGILGYGLNKWLVFRK